MQVAKPVLEELRSMSTADAKRVITFLEQLANNPYEQTLIGTANAKGDLFASRVTDKLYVYWSFEVKGQVPDLEKHPRVNVLGLARKNANHGLVLLRPTMHEKLKTA